MGTLWIYIHMGSKISGKHSLEGDGYPVDLHTHGLKISGKHSLVGSGFASIK
jgi:hypothetical protein